MFEYRIVINEGGPFAPSSENAIYFAPQVDVEVHYLNEDERPNESWKQAVFVPNNGPNAGMLHRVPFERVVAIIEPHD
jgi:hypothetical protein